MTAHREDLDQEEKAKFGEYCSGEDGKGREWFARFVSAQVSARWAKDQQPGQHHHGKESRGHKPVE